MRMTDAERPRVLIAGDRFGYPHGAGAAARVTAYARGLQDAGAVVHVVSMMSPNINGPDLNETPSGVHDGVSYEYACGTRTRAPSFVGRRWLEAKVPVGVWIAARRLFRDGAGPKAIIAYTTEPRWIAFAALVAKTSGAVCLVEICEMPFVHERDSVKRAFKLWLQDSFAYKMVDGFIAISTDLVGYVERHAQPGAKVARVPTLVSASDFERHSGHPASSSPRQVVYVGDFSQEGEITDLMTAFALVALDRPDVELTLVGHATPDRQADIAGRAVGLGIEGRVRLTGQVKREGLPRLLGAASALVLLRRDAAFSRAGLPSKLAEYLASGRPVVVTAIGDIPRYLVDGVDAYLAPPGDPAAFAKRLGYVLDNESEAREVGASGRLVALRRFDRRRHGARLAAFISSVHQCRYHSTALAGDLPSIPL
jgi:glycosyltransferase involved in cell wall biosynthesis